MGRASPGRRSKPRGSSTRCGGGPLWGARVFDSPAVAFRSPGGPRPARCRARRFGPVGPAAVGLPPPCSARWSVVPPGVGVPRRVRRGGGRGCPSVVRRSRGSVPRPVLRPPALPPSPPPRLRAGAVLRPSFRGSGRRARGPVGGGTGVAFLPRLSVRKMSTGSRPRPPWVRPRASPPASGGSASVFGGWSRAGAGRGGFSG